MSAPTEYRPSRTRMIVLSLILLLFDAGYVWMLVQPAAKPGDRTFGVVGLLLFGPAFVATLFPIVRPRALLRLDAEGLREFGHFGGENLRLSWSEVIRVEPFRWRLVPMLALVPFDEARILANASPRMRKAAAGNLRTYGHPFAIDARMYGRKTDDVAAEIERRLAALPIAAPASPRPKRPASGNLFR